MCLLTSVIAKFHSSSSPSSGASQAEHQILLEGFRVVASIDIATNMRGFGHPRLSDTTTWQTAASLRGGLPSPPVGSGIPQLPVTDDEQTDGVGTLVARLFGFGIRAMNRASESEVGICDGLVETRVTACVDAL
jgi:hypothetical protein